MERLVSLYERLVSLFDYCYECKSLALPSCITYMLDFSLIEFLTIAVNTLI